MSEPPPSTRDEAARLRQLFEGVDLPEIQGVHFQGMSHEEIAQLLPPYGGKHPMKAILIDRETGRAYGIASGWEAETVTHNGIPFKAGAVTSAVAVEAGDGWRQLGNHCEPVAAAFMRRQGIQAADVYINLRNPCWGVPDGTGCHFWLPTLLAEGSQMTVYNRLGANVSTARPDRVFNYTGLPD